MEKHGVAKDAKIIDFGCGSGAIAREAEKLGWHDLQMTGLDGCEEIQKRCAQYKQYKELKTVFLGRDEFPAHWVDAFDYSVSLGTFIINHFPPSALDDMMNAVKKNGIIFFNSRKDQWVEIGLKPHLDKLLAEGKLEQIDEIEFHKYPNIRQEMKFFKVDVVGTMLAFRNLKPD